MAAWLTDKDAQHFSKALAAPQLPRLLRLFQAQRVLFKLWTVRCCPFCAIPFLPSPSYLRKGPRCATRRQKVCWHATHLRSIRYALCLTAAELALFVGNVVLHDAVERVYIGNQYGEQPCGVYLIRGENIMLLGEVDPLKDASLPLEKRPMIEMLSKQKELIEESRRLYRLKRQIQRDFGLLDSEITLMMDADV